MDILLVGMVPTMAEPFMGLLLQSCLQHENALWGLLVVFSSFRWRRQPRVTWEGWSV